MKVVIGLWVLASIGVLWSIFAPQTIVFSYATSEQCVSSPRLFPSTGHIKQQGRFAVRRPASVSVGSFPLYSRSLCARPIAAPPERTTTTFREKQFGLSPLSKRISVLTPSYVQIAKKNSSLRDIAPDRLLTEKLTGNDQTFSYTLRAGTVQAPCAITDRKLRCDLRPLQLTYAQRYDLQIIRQYKGEDVSALASIPVKTISPLGIVTTSIAPGTSVESKPTEIILTTDKKLTTMGTVQLVAKGANNTVVPVPATTTFADTTIRLQLTQELGRKTAFEVRLMDTRAVDSSGFVGNTYTLPFTTSGGPKVKGASIGSRDVGLSQSIVLTFDQVLLASQNIATSLTFTVNGAAAPAALSISGNKLTIKPASAFPVCAQIKVLLNNNVQNQYGIAGDSAWTLNSRATCYTTFSIGTSVQGRAITAYKFGTGASSILYLGAMHGSEANSKQIMQEWINELNRNPERIPAGRSLVIIPSVNPDGIARGSRYNAHEVDLNRNFPANDWKSVVTSPTSKTPTPAGGPAPLSEPESQAVARYIGQLSPLLVMSFHSKAAVVEANEAGSSVSIANAYASRSGYRAVPKSQSAPVFQYDTTGAMEDWLRDKSGRAAIVVELASSTSSEFARNKNALWYTVGL